MESVEIRDFRPDDAAALIGLARELQAWEGSLYDRMKPPDKLGDWYVEMLLESARRSKGRLLVAAEGARLLGYTLILTAVSSEEEPDEIAYSYALVQDLVVTQEARGRGLGAKLLAQCEKIAREAGAPWLRIQVLAANSSAARLYRRVGFVPLYSIMEKPLGR